MEIIIDSDYVIIKLTGGSDYAMNYKQLADVEKAIEIIRNIQKAAHVDSATITVT